MILGLPGDLVWESVGCNQEFAEGDTFWLVEFQDNNGRATDCCSSDNRGTA